MKRTFLLAMLLLVTQGARAQVAESSDLYAQILAADETLFERGFNQCDQAARDEIISPKLMFFHDQNGMTDSKSQFVKGLNESICSNPDKKPIRKLVAGSMQVFALRNEGKLYGAVQSARHDFYIREPGKELYQTNTARMVNVWLLEEGRWRLRESISYDHQDPRLAK
jgi:hypothetical protein